MRRLVVRARVLVAGVRTPSAQGGQVIVLFAFSLVALLLIAALVLDVARVYTALQYQRSVADAAALAGAQDLQDLGKRTVSDADYPRAECDAYDLLVRDLGGSQPPLDCTSSSVLAGFNWGPATTGTPSTTYRASITAPTGIYSVAITTPYPYAQTVDPSRAVKVSISRPFQLTFGNLVCLLPGSGCSSGAPIWSPTVASVAGGGFGGQYSVVTLRGTHWLKKQDSNADDITLTGGSTLNVVQGDVGTNTDLVTSGCGSSSPSALILANGFLLDHYDDISETWCPPVPEDHVITAPIPDPGYWAAPSDPSLPVYSTPAAAQDSSATCTTAIASAGGNGYNANNWPGLAQAGNLSTTNTVCYKPGVYTFDIHNTANTTVVLLEPGMYWFNAGLTMYGPMIGGYTAKRPGVTLVFPEGSQCTATGGSSACNFAGNNSPLIALNMGSCTPSQVQAEPLCAESLGATPAPTWASGAWSGSPVAQVSFSGTGGTPITVPETLVVTHDPGCIVQADGTEPSTCNDKANNVLNLPGGGSVYIAGVQYAPSDNVHVSGGSGSNGTIGQIIAWTVTYNGSATVSEYYPGSVDNMVLRLDTECSPGVACP